MAEQQELPYLSDPLSEITRRERKALLGVSAVSVAMVHIGLVPQRIAMLGVEFGQINQSALLVVLALVVLYFLAAFLIYGATDFVAAQRRFHRQRVDFVRNAMKRSIEDDPKSLAETTVRAAETALRPIFSSAETAYRVGRARFAFEFLLPAAFGIYAVILLCLRALPG